MPRLESPTEQNIEPTAGLDKHLGSPMLGMWSWYPQTTPAPQGSDSLELIRRLAEVFRSLEELETVRPYLGNVPHPYLAWLSSRAGASEVSLDYQSLPPARTVHMNAQFFIRGRGQPKPYSLEDE